MPIVRRLAVLVLAALVAGAAAACGSEADATPTASPAGSVAPPTAGPSLSPGPTVEPGDNLPTDAISSVEFLKRLETDRAALVGGTFAVEGVIARNDSVQCFDDSDPVSCPGIVLAGDAPARIYPLVELGPGPWASGTGEPVEGIWAFVVTPDDDLLVPGPIIDLLGPIESPDGGGLAWTVEDLAAAAPGAASTLFPVAGWLVSSEPQPCETPDPDPFVPSYGCPTAEYVTADEFRPTQPDGTTLEPPGPAISVPSGSYDRYAPQPTRDEDGIVPRRDVYLLRRIEVPCPPEYDCIAPELGWEVVVAVASMPEAGAPG